MTKISTDPPAFRVRPAQPEEAGAFFAQTPEQDAQMGAIGHVRMDFGGSGKEFWHSWHPRGREELNSPEFKAELQQVVDTLRETVLKDLSSIPPCGTSAMKTAAKFRAAGRRIMATS